MKKTAIRSIAFLLSLVLMFGAVCALGTAIGVERASAAGYQSEMWMLCGNTTALLRGTKTPISTAHPTATPYAYLGNSWTCYVPLSAPCLYTGGSWSLGGDGKTVTVTPKSGAAAVTLTVGELAWSGDQNGEKPLMLPPVLTDGEVYISSVTVGWIFGVKTFFNYDIGLYIISDASMSYSRNYSSTKTQIETLRYLLFDNVTGNGIYNDVMNCVGIDTHPRLLADQSRFDELRELYLYYSDPEHFGEATDNRLYSMVSRYVTSANSKFGSIFLEQTDDDGIVSYSWREGTKEAARQPYYLYDENGNRLVGKTSYTNSAGETINITDVYGTSPLYGDGYDNGGRSKLSKQSENLQYFAFAWQITRDEKYAYAFYELGCELGKWEHWGEGHFLDCADGAAPFALGLDWIWHAYDETPAKRDALAKILYDKAVNVAYWCIYNPSTGKSNGILHRSTTMGENWNLTGYTNNWNTVCCSGITMAALTVLGYSSYASEAKYVMEKQIGALYKCLMQYVPDGSYIESPGYWAYGTNTFMRMLGCLQSAAGTTYGYLNSIGLQNSYFFANNICDADYTVWNYHDGGRSRIDTTTFYMAASLYGDPEIAHHRDLFAERYPTVVSIFDPLYYDPSLSEGATEEGVLDANFTGIDTVTMRSSWESGATFTGLHVGPNSVSHGDVDCGNFYLEMGGVLWFGDPGAEDYNIAPYNRYFNGNYRYKFYRKTLEAHNTILIKPQSGDTSSDIYKYGQVFNGYSSTYARVNTFVSEEDGAYAVADMKPQYGSTCSSATRGLLFTNSRTTVVVQDDIEFSRPTSLVWIGAMQTDNVVISDDGRTAILKTYVTGKLSVLRATLISDDENLKFEMSLSGILLPQTITNANNNNGAYPKASTVQPRLLIRADNVSSFHCAVVFETVRLDGSRMPTVGYEYSSPSDWTITDNEWLIEADSDITYNNPSVYKYQTADLAMLVNRLKKAEGNWPAITELLRQKADLPDNINTEDAAVRQLLVDYRYYLNAANAYLRDVNKSFRTAFDGAMLTWD